MTNPFFYGTPVGIHQFLNQKKSLRRVINRILNGGQSTAIVGEPRMGKTSILEYLAASENCENLYEGQGDSLIFCLMDIQMLGGQFNQAQFWEQALTPLTEKVIDLKSDTPLAKHYRICQQNHFGTFTLERLFTQLQKDNWRLVLLLDEFDLLLHHPTLNSAEFFGCLRALASRSRGSLAIVTASRQSLTKLNEMTQSLNPTGSPYFNIFAEITLGPFQNKDIVELLERAGDRFSKEDRRYIDAVAGGHPYLLQAAAGIMWEAIDEGNNDRYQRYLLVGQRLYQENQLHFGDTWRVWSPFTRRAITAIALAQMAYLLPDRNFLVDEFVKDLCDLSPEINTLKAVGLVVEDDKVMGGYRLAQGAMLWWLADELVRTIRQDKPFEQWLRDQEMVGLLTRKEIDHLAKAAKFLAGLLHQGAIALIEAFAKGLVGGK